jgi:hypothetical protein
MVVLLMLHLHRVVQALHPYLLVVDPLAVVPYPYLVLINLALFLVRQQVLVQPVVLVLVSVQP